MGNDLGSKDDKDSIFSPSKDDALCGDMTLKQRVIGFLACSITGFLISWILTFLFIFGGLQMTTFALVFSFCQILNISASCFLSTPKGHCKAMKKKERIIPSVVYITMIILTIVIAVATKVKGLVLLCVVILTIAYYWYTISFIPFGQKILKKICGACLEG